jgi:glucose-6-phosphate isomerase
MERRSDRIHDHCERAAKGRFMRKKSQWHHNLEAGIIEAITNVVIVGMGMSNHKKIISRL